MSALAPPHAAASPRNLCRNPVGDRPFQRTGVCRIGNMTDLNRRRDCDDCRGPAWKWFQHPILVVAVGGGTLTRRSITPQAFNHTAQGRESASAPWGHGIRSASTLKGSHHRWRQIPMKPFQGIGFVIDRHPGCARRLATLGCAILRLRRKNHAVLKPRLRSRARSLHPPQLIV